ncbi:MAG: hypothetical protein ACTSV2_10820 [Candidatus Thorarchaeota archaeon]
MVTYQGSGESPDDPIIIEGVSGNFEAEQAEYSYLSQKFGNRGVDWKMLQQSLIESNGRMMDRMELELSGGSQVTLYFDITEYFGQF